MTVVIATFGAWRWAELAQERAVPSAKPQAPIVCWHGRSLADARNRALKVVETEWVIHLDADDELEPGYVEAMGTGTADLRAPAVRYANEAARVPRVVGHRHDCTAACLPEGNFICIGAAVRADLLRGAGGFRDEPIWEDWSAWLRCWRAGGTVETVPEAVYRAHGAGRNGSLTAAERRRVFAEIAA